MNNTNHELLLYVIIGIAAMFVFGFSFLLVVVRSQRKKSQLQKSISKLRVEQQNQLIEAAVRSEEQERHRIAETLHDEVGANLDDNYATENPENDISIYRIVQELINNTLKYANATEFLISSVLTGNELDLAIFHNGDGLTQEQFEELRYQKEGLGLKNIQNRIKLLLPTIIKFIGTGLK